MSVGITIKQQIMAADYWLLAALGARDYVKNDEPSSLIKDTMAPDELVEVGPYLKFTVNGSKHRGQVIIAQNGNDLYDVLLFKSTKYKHPVFGFMTPRCILVSTSSDIDSENLPATLKDLVG